MTTPVTDRTSNKNEHIVHAAEVLGRSEQRKAVFRAIYRGKSKVKTVLQLMESTQLSQVRVLQHGKNLATNELVKQVNVDGKTGYEKIPFFATHRDKVLSLADNASKREAIPTKRNPRASKAR